MLLCIAYMKSKKMFEIWMVMKIFNIFQAEMFLLEIWQFSINFKNLAGYKYRTDVPNYLRELMKSTSGYFFEGWIDWK